MHAHTPPFTKPTGAYDARKLYDETRAIAAAQDARHAMTDAERDAKLRTVAHHIRHAKLLMDEIFAEEMASSKRTLAELAQESQRWGMYADADTPEKSANVNSAPKWSPQWMAEQGVPAESSYIASFSPNGSRLATEDEVAGLREHLTAEQLREYGIGDVEPETLRGIPDSFTDSRGNRITRRDVRSDRHSSQNVTDVVHSAHPMHAEALRLADEPPEDRL